MLPSSKDARVQDPGRFADTAIPALVDYLQGGDSIDEFLGNFPSVRREQAVAALEILRDVLLSGFDH